MMLLYCRCFSRDSYASKSALFQSHTGPNKLNSSHLPFRLFDNHGCSDSCDTESLQIVFKFSLTFPHSLLFMYDCCLVPALKLQVCYTSIPVISPLKLLWILDVQHLDGYTNTLSAMFILHAHAQMYAQVT
jgi:hypothetical protein